MAARHWIMTMAGALAVLTLTGCAKQTTRAEDRNAAERRWQSVRSSLVIDEARGKFETGDLDEAQRKLAEALEIDPTNPQLYTLLGRIELERGRLDRSNTLLKQAVAVEPRFAEAHYYRGIILQRWQRFEDALASYQTAYDLVPDNPSYLLAVVETRIAMGDDAGALSMIEERLDFFEGDAAVRVAAAEIHMLKGRYEQAVSLYRQALVLKPDDVRTLEELAAAYVAGGEHLEAASVYEHLLSLPENAGRNDLRVTLAQELRRGGRLGAAREILIELTRRAAGDVEAWILLGETALAMDDLSGALQAADRAMQLAPQRDEGFLLAGLVWYRRDRLDLALGTLDQAARLAPESTAALIVRGMALEQAGRPEAAKQAYREALRRQPDDARARQLLQRLEMQTAGL